MVLWHYGAACVTFEQVSMFISNDSVIIGRHRNKVLLASVGLPIKDLSACFCSIKLRSDVVPYACKAGTPGDRRCPSGLILAGACAGFLCVDIVAQLFVNYDGLYLLFGKSRKATR